MQEQKRPSLLGKKELFAVLGVLVVFAFAGIFFLNQKQAPPQPSGIDYGENQGNDSNPLSPQEDQENTQVTSPDELVVGENNGQEQVTKPQEEPAPQEDPNASNGEDPDNQTSEEEEDIGTLTCSELEGRICQEGQTCPVELRKTTDTDECCLVECQ